MQQQDRKFYLQIRALKGIFNPRQGMNLLCGTMAPNGPFSVHRSLSLRSRIRLEKLTVLQLLKKILRNLCKLRVRYHTHNSVPFVILNQSTHPIS